MSPCHLSYYSLLVGGLPGAERLGLEVDYWSAGLTRDFIEQIPEDSIVYVAPVLHELQLRAVTDHTPVLRQRGIKLIAFEYGEQQQPGYMLCIQRRADLPVWLHHPPEPAERRAVFTRLGVPLAELYWSPVTLQEQLIE